LVCTLFAFATATSPAQSTEFLQVSQSNTLENQLASAQAESIAAEQELKQVSTNSAAALNEAQHEIETSTSSEATQEELEHQFELEAAAETEAEENGNDISSLSELSSSTVSQKNGTLSGTVVDTKDGKGFALKKKKHHKKKKSKKSKKSKKGKNSTRRVNKVHDPNSGPNNRNSHSIGGKGGKGNEIVKIERSEDGGTPDVIHLKNGNKIYKPWLVDPLKRIQRKKMKKIKPHSKQRLMTPHEREHLDVHPDLVEHQRVSDIRREFLRLNPDNKRALLARFFSPTQLWLNELKAGSFPQLTFDQVANSQGRDGFAQRRVMSGVTGNIQASSTNNIQQHITVRHHSSAVRQRAEVSALRAATRTLRKINKKRKQYKQALAALSIARNKIRDQIHEHHVLRAIKAKKVAARAARRAAWSSLLRENRFRKALLKKIAKALSKGHLSGNARREAIVALLKRYVTPKQRAKLHAAIHFGKHNLHKRLRKINKKHAKRKAKRAHKKAKKAAKKAKKAAKKAKKAAKKASKPLSHHTIRVDHHANRAAHFAQMAKEAAAKGNKKLAARYKARAAAHSVSHKKHKKAVKKHHSRKNKKAGRKGKKGKKGKKAKKVSRRAQLLKLLRRKALAHGRRSSASRFHTKNLTKKDQHAIDALIKRIHTAIKNKSTPHAYRHRSSRKRRSGARRHPAGRKAARKARKAARKARKTARKAARVARRVARQAAKKAKKAAAKKITKKVKKALKKKKHSRKHLTTVGKKHQTVGSFFGKRRHSKAITPIPLIRFSQVHTETETELKEAEKLAAEAEQEALEQLNVETEVDQPEDLMMQTEAKVEAATEITNEFLHDHNVE